LSQQKRRSAYFVGVCVDVPRIHTIFEGTSEIQQLVIARAISGLRVE
jgi:alkylation response protein AidB-like acyl-CoA dehydrogenase